MILICKLTGRKLSLGCFLGAELRSVGVLKGIHPVLEMPLAKLVKLLHPSVWVTLDGPDKRLALLAVPIVLNLVGTSAPSASPQFTESPEGAQTYALDMLAAEMYPRALRLVTLAQSQGFAFSEYLAMPRWAITAQLGAGLDAWRALHDFFMACEEFKSATDRQALERKAREVDAEVTARMSRDAQRHGLGVGFSLPQARDFLLEATPFKGRDLETCAKLLSVSSSDAMLYSASPDWELVDKLETVLLQVNTYSERKTIALRHLGQLQETAKMFGLRASATGMSIFDSLELGRSEDSLGGANDETDFTSAGSTSPEMAKLFDFLAKLGPRK